MVGQNNGAQPFDELGNSHFKLDFNVDSLNISRTSHLGQQFNQTITLNNSQAR